MPHRLAKKHKVRRFKSSRIALQQLEPFFRNVGRPGKSILVSGRPLKKYGNLLPRELIANWLLTVVGDFLTSSERFQFTTDPSGGDGIIYDTITKQAVWTEHVIVRAANSDDNRDIQTKILDAVAQKIQKGGRAYARGKTLIVFLFSAGKGATWWPDRVAAALPHPLYFEAVWVIGFERFEAGDQVYAVTRLDLRAGHAPVWWVRIAADFNGWTVSTRRSGTIEEPS